MREIPFDALAQAVGGRASRRRVAGGVLALLLGSSQVAPVEAGNRRCAGCQHHNDCPGQAKCRSYQGQKSCCNGYWWRGDCYKDKQVERKGWSWHVDGGELYYCKAKTGRQLNAKLICRG